MRYRTYRHRLLFLKLLTTFLDTAAAAAASLNLLLAPAVVNTSTHEYHCNNLPSWAGGRRGSPAYEPEDCNRAIRMFEQDVARNPGKAQWLSVGFPHAMPGYGTPVWTPQRYTSGECSDPFFFFWIAEPKDV